MAHRHQERDAVRRRAAQPAARSRQESRSTGRRGGIIRVRGGCSRREGGGARGGGFRGGRGRSGSGGAREHGLRYGRGSGRGGRGDLIVAGSVGREPVVERTCIGCRERSAKSSMVRIVRSPDGAVSVDVRGSAPGRGCYLHPERTCIAQADRRGAVPRALRVALSREEVANLRKMTERTLDR